MNLNMTTGELEISPNIRIYPGMTFADLNKNDVNWEVWITSGDDPIAYRTIIPASEETHGQKIILITYFAPQGKKELTEWNLKPMGKFTGTQKKIEGKNTKAARTWFKERFKADLPLNYPWGSIDAAYDAHNLSTLVIYNR